MNLLVTGASGFLGRAVVRTANAKGHHVYAVSRDWSRSAAAESSGIHRIGADMNDSLALVAALADIDVVVHCAASLTGGREEQRRDTMRGTRILLEAMKSAKVQRLVLVGSMAVYNYQKIPAQAVLDESSPLATASDDQVPYIVAKLAQETLARECSQLTQCTIVRPGLIYGPGRTWFYHLGSRIGALWVALAGSGQLPLIHVDSCADALVLAAENLAGRQDTLNLVDSELPTRRGYMSALATLQPSQALIIDIPWTLLEIASMCARWPSRVMTLLAPLSPATLHARCKPIRYSNTRAKATLSWTPATDYRRLLADATATSPA